jgi:bifunctional non-homologous end joining protein LigD
MLLLPVSALPQGPDWQYELDGYRALTMKTNGNVQLRSRNNKDFNPRYPSIVQALATLPDETVIDGEVVATDASGRPSFNALQNHGAGVLVYYYAFDVLFLAGRNVMAQPLAARNRLLHSRVLPKLCEPIRGCPALNASLPEVIQAVRAQGLEGVVVKHRNSVYEPGRRSGAWRKMRINHGQEFVIGGYTAGGNTFDSVIFGYYLDDQLLYAGRTRNGLTAALREQLVRLFRGLESPLCPFANLPEARSGRWGEGLTAEKMSQCKWLKPVLVGRVEFVEWTPDGHLRHARFVALRADKDAREVQREA